MRWTFRQRRFQELLAVSAENRPEGCQNDEEIAETLGINLMTLRGWTLQPGWWESVSDIAAVHIGRYLYAIYEAMVKQAVTGSVQAAKFCLDVLGLTSKELTLNVKHYEDDRLVVFLPAEKGPPIIRPMLEAPTLEDNQIVEGKVLESKPVEDELVIVL